MTLRVEEPDGEWAALRANVDAERFDRQVVGPYKLGLILRPTSYGQVSMALHEAIDRVVELELFEALAGTQAAGPDGALMPDLAHAASIEHPHVAKIIGAGMEGGAPYLVRPLILGRTLDRVVAQGGPLSIDHAACVGFALSEGLHALAEHSPEPGACSIGGFDERDVYLAFDGGVLILGAGTRSARLRGAFSEAIDRDRESLSQLLKRLGLEDDGTRTFAELSRELRHQHRDALARRNELLGSLLRDRFDAAIREEREFFGLIPIQ